MGIHMKILGALLSILVLQCMVAFGFTNPIKKTDGSDPFMVSLHLWRVVNTIDEVIVCRFSTKDFTVSPTPL